MTGSALATVKANLRRHAAAVRATAHALHGKPASEELAQHGMMALPLTPGSVVSAYLAMRDELDPGPLLQRLEAQGLVTALPTIIARAAPLVFRRWRAGEPTRPAGFGTAEPLGTAQEVVPDLLLVPLLAFDANGHRLGYGGGFYDRTLAQLRASKRVFAVGIAFDEQEVGEVPHDLDDQRLDAALTPSGSRRFIARKA